MGCINSEKAPHLLHPDYTNHKAKQIFICPIEQVPYFQSLILSASEYTNHLPVISFLHLNCDPYNIPLSG